MEKYHIDELMIKCGISKVTLLYMYLISSFGNVLNLQSGLNRTIDSMEDKCDTLMKEVEEKKRGMADLSARLSLAEHQSRSYQQRIEELEVEIQKEKVNCLISSPMVICLYYTDQRDSMNKDWVRLC